MGYNGTIKCGSPLRSGLPQGVEFGDSFRIPAHRYISEFRKSSSYPTPSVKPRFLLDSSPMRPIHIKA